VLRLLTMAGAVALFGAITVANASLPPKNALPPRGSYVFIEEPIVVGPVGRTHGSQHIDSEEAQRILIESAFHFLARGLS